jgi:cytochrome c-type biogenesis protein CcmH
MTPSVGMLNVLIANVRMSNMRMAALMILVLALEPVVAPVAAGAQAGTGGSASRTSEPATDSVLEARTREIAAVLRCPVCQGESIQDSPAQLALQMREVVREQLRDGRTPDEIKAYFVARYGEWILLEPQMKGFNVLLYAFPVVLLVGGLAVFAVVVKRWTTAPPGANAHVAE